MSLRLSDVTALLDGWYDPAWAEDWDAVGLVCGDPDQPVARVLFAVDPAPAVVDEALAWGADLVVCHHPLLLSPVHGVAATTPKGRVVHRLQRAGTALLTAHTNADVPADGVNESLARAVGILDPQVVVASDGAPPAYDVVEPAPGHPAPPGARTDRPARRAHHAAGLRGPGVGGAAGDGARRAGRGRPGPARATGRGVRRARATSCSTTVRGTDADVYLTSDLRHHPAAEFLETDGPALVDVAHWAAEWTWLPVVERELLGAAGAGRYGGDPGERARHRSVDLPGRPLTHRRPPEPDTEEHTLKADAVRPAQAAGRPGARRPARPAAGTSCTACRRRRSSPALAAERCRGRRPGPRRADRRRRPDPRAAQGRRRRRAGQDPPRPATRTGWTRGWSPTPRTSSGCSRSWSPWSAGSPSSRTTELEVMERLEDAQADQVRAGRPARRDRRRGSPSWSPAATSRPARSTELAATADRASARSTAEGVPADLLALYERIRAQKGGVGAAAILRARRCSGCSLELDRADLGVDREGADATRWSAARSATGSWCAPAESGI